MRRLCLSLTLAALSVLANAEDQPAPTPAPAQPTPTQDPSAHVATPANAPAAAASPSVTPGSRPVSITATLGEGYDSNILLLPSENPASSNVDGLALTAGARINGRLLQVRSFRLGLVLDGDAADYPDERKADLVRAGAGLTAQGEIGGVHAGSTTAYNHFWLDGRFAASAISENLYAAKTWRRNVSIVSGGVQFLHYHGNDDESGTQGDLAYRHWFLLEDRNVRRRIELAVRAVRYAAGGDADSYWGYGGSLGCSYRAFGGAKPEAGTLDLTARAGVELRRYDDGRGTTDAERQAITSYSGAADVWMCANASIGAYVGYTVRNSNIPRDAYDRFQAGGRLTVVW